MSGPSLELPPGLRRALAGHAWQRQTVGQSPAEVYALEGPGGERLFVKTEPSGAFAELRGEAARLKWLAGMAVPCPRVLAFEEFAGRCWLLTSAVPGRNLAEPGDLPAGQVVQVAARALRELHSLDVASCPFDHRLDARIELARRRLEAGEVDDADFDEERRGRSAGEVFEELLAGKPAGEDLVVAHGDAYLQNLMAHRGAFSGFVDCGRVGVADRCQDLALACQGIGHDLGDAWVAPFLAAYGPEAADPGKIAYYLLLDEFF
jgi:aminoglycoside 3'-phosphotransferase-2